MITALSAPFPGARRPLEEGAKLGLWDFVLLDGAVHIPKFPKSDIYLLAAWHPAYEQLLALGDKRGIVWSSSVGEMDFTPIEQRYLWEIERDPRIDFLWFGDKGLALAHPQKGFYAPYPLSCNASSPQVKKEDIATLFCPTKPSKNIYTQLCALKIVQKQTKLTLHTNIQGYDAILSELDHVRHGWLPQPGYQKLIASARVNLAVSWAETFNYQCAEALLWGTPSVTSYTVPIPGMQVRNANDAEEIAESIVMLLDMPKLVEMYSKELGKLASEWNAGLTETLKRLNLLPTELDIKTV
jgi:glycosyltransferase involved in cell wall biosynthesis